MRWKLRGLSFLKLGQSSSTQMIMAQEPAIVQEQVVV